ncbi:hypothetical protein [Chryseobacterium angstadtii]|nr:hypothetical protein [Chryseobacterium angstadtii]
MRIKPNHQFSTTVDLYNLKYDGASKFDPEFGNEYLSRLVISNKEF